MPKKKAEDSNTPKNKGGRPVKWTEANAIALAEELIDWLKEEDNIWFERFLYEVKGLYPQIISEMSEKYPKFSETIKKAKRMQEGKIIDYAFKHKINPTMAIFILKCAYKYNDKPEEDSASAPQITNINVNIKKKDGA